MTTLTRVTDLSVPPIVGRRYLVPTVRYDWPPAGGVAAWPVFPTKHEDAEHLNFPWPHYHIDPRFLNKRAWARVEDYGADWRSPLAICQAIPLNNKQQGGARFLGSERLTIAQAAAETAPHPKIVWRPRVCHREIGAYQFAQAAPIMAMQACFAGQQSKRAATGLVCPHKHFPLGSIPVIDGVITCPLHGLRIRAADGRVEPDPATERAQALHAERVAEAAS